MKINVTKYVKSVVLILIIGSSIYSAQSGNPQMYLCVDSMKEIKSRKSDSSVKFVYGYINGIRTECMSEYEFREKYCKKQFESSTISQPDSQKILEQKGLKRKHIQLSLLEAIYRGKKDLAGLKMCSFDLAGLDLSGADLRNADLNSADLRNAKLCGANLSGANLTSAYLKNADLRNANLENVNLKGCYLQQANLTDASGFTIVDIKMAASLYKTIIDPEMAAQIKQDCPGKLKKPEWGWLKSDSTTSNFLTSDNDTADRKTFH
jgi:hypothetical protein